MLVLEKGKDYFIWFIAWCLAMKMKTKHVFFLNQIYILKKLIGFSDELFYANEK